jgi:prepilin-type N-terminal cleavage/methylation domain-containing protein
MPEKLPPSPPAARKSLITKGFTLIELLVVVGVIVLMMGLAIPAFNAIRGGTDFNSALYSVSGALQEGRAYAMANNTYVLVGFAEVSALQNTSATPQQSGTGRLAIAIIASKDGTRPYQSLVDQVPTQLTGTNYLTIAPPAGYGSGAQYIAVTKLITISNIHMVDLQSDASQEPTAGGMVRPWHGDSIPAAWPWENYSLGNQTMCTAGNCFLWPLGTSAGGNPAPQYVFTQVIEFDPQGSARIMLANSDVQGGVSQKSIPYFIEIGLEPAFGGSAKTPPTVEEPSAEAATGQIAAVQVDGMTGATRTYRP